uniref:Uncharacterized protein n=1 Tax=Mycena chlorophos TaxID=658473 RepID=A0ABQ0KX86_MYCCL|nr:predicted protein [Mycena chlorophos]
MSVPPTLNCPVGQLIVPAGYGRIRLEWHPIQPPPAVPTFVNVLNHAEHSRTHWAGSNGSFLNNTPLLALPGAQDGWHRTSGSLPLAFVPSNPKIDFRPGQTVRKAPISIPFAPTRGPGTLGVALAEILASCRGVADPDVPIVQHVPPAFRTEGSKHALLVLEWPGHPRFMSTFQLRTDSREYIARQLLALQVANAFAYYASVIESEPSAAQSASPLIIDQIRLLEVVSFNAKDFYVRVLVVDRPKAAKG